jgi:hypothetical protein
LAFNRMPLVLLFLSLLLSLSASSLYLQVGSRDCVGASV